ncbi:MAG TPA: alpha/beta hydrolase-fold protein [Solirubrobacteraceae bacterium]|jgi:S-formylglutathione hydrolase FrmB|nr:alpha/beta hydrolase-fold protein [Solirubrobacteraceae bacterium]
MKEVSGPVGAPWQRELSGTVDTLVVESEILAENPLGDPARRPLYIYRSPGVGDEPVPAVFVIQGFTGQLDRWFARDAFEPTVFERLDRLFQAGETPPGIVVFVDAWTSLGGSQFLNSPAIGRYQDYLCDELVPFVDERYPTLADREHRALAGKSSGGYGAMVVPMQRPDVFGALASHAGDALFEVSCLPEFRDVVRALRDHFGGSYEVFFERLADADHFDFSLYGVTLEMYAYAAAYSPDLARPGKVLLPFDPATGALVDDVWARWLEHDPVRMVPRHLDALRSMRRIYLDAGTRDEAYLDLGAQAVSAALQAHDIEHTLELFDGRHGGITWRYPLAVRELLVALHS